MFRRFASRIRRIKNAQALLAILIAMLGLAAWLIWNVTPDGWVKYALLSGHGLVLGLLYPAVVWLLCRRRDYALALAEKMTASLRQREEELRKARDESQWNAQRRLDELSLTNQVLQEEIAHRLQAEVQLENKIKQLNRINAELNDFAYIISHDLRAPLRAIGSLAHWIAEDNAGVLNQESLENLETLMNRVKRMDGLISGILQFSRIGRIEPTRESLDSETIVHDVIDSLAPPDHIAVRVEGALPTISYDRSHLQQLFQNLIGNAMKHLGKPQGEIVVSCVETADFHEFTVRDNGVGIEEKHFERIFKIFQTLKPRDQLEASGIGLTIVKAIVEKHGGKVRVESTVGAGAAFSFTVLKQIESSDNAPGMMPFPVAADNLSLNTPVEV
jgi:light-regulated signal transduction histidine kinase (bacteriophytochrome)